MIFLFSAFLLCNGLLDEHGVPSLRCHNTSHPEWLSHRTFSQAWPTCCFDWLGGVHLVYGRLRHVHHLGVLLSFSLIIFRDNFQLYLMNPFIRKNHFYLNFLYMKSFLISFYNNSTFYTTKYLVNSFNLFL